jgi:hypothetical protein
MASTKKLGISVQLSKFLNRRQSFRALAVGAWFLKSQTPFPKVHSKSKTPLFFRFLGGEFPVFFIDFFPVLAHYDAR